MKAWAGLFLITGSVPYALAIQEEISEAVSPSEEREHTIVRPLPWELSDIEEVPSLPSDGHRPSLEKE